MGRYRDQQSIRMISTIDVTPLVDLTFLLLIVFMVTAPVLEFALEVSPPALNAETVEPAPHRIVNLTRDGAILWEQRPVTREELQHHFRELARTAPDTQVFVRADESRPYGDVMALLRAAQNAGIANVSLVTRDESDQ